MHPNDAIDDGQSLELGKRASEVPMRPWNRPVVTRIELARTMNAAGSGGDAGTSTTTTL